MTLDVEKIRQHQFASKQYSYAEKDVSLYALSIGAAADPTDQLDLPLVYELHNDGFQVFPTFAVTFPFVVFWQILEVPGLEFNPMMLLHGEQSLAIKKPLATSGIITNHASIADIYDKGSGALVILDVECVDEAGEVVAHNQSSLFFRGLGGFGGERGPSSKVNLSPERPPDAVFRDKTSPNQALLYRLSSGDRNPLHADPQMAAVGGFDRPILHGLCTLGFGARAVVREFAGNDVSRFRSIKTRFTKHVFPGETLITEMWRESDERIAFQCKVEERDEVVLSNAVIVLNAEARA